MAMEVSIMLFISTHIPPPGGDGRFWNGLVQQYKKTEKAMKEVEVEVNRPQSQTQ